MTEGQQAPGDDAPADVRPVADVETLRAMADPIRMSVLSALMDTSQGDLPVTSVKELAAHLGEPQTKLYRHVKQLEAAGLVRVAATRLVSGILEQRYQACQRDLRFDSGFLREHADESEAAMRAVLDNFRAGFITAFRRLPADPGGTAESYRRPVLFAGQARVSPARAAEIRARLQEVMQWLDAAENQDKDGVAVDVVVGYYAPAGHGQE
jgi:DNA-binding transcriptional ArsR family regulator